MCIFKTMIAAIITACCANFALADSIVFTVDNEFTEDVAIEFYSTERDHVWPGGDQIWVVGVSAGEISYPLDCNRGELICFGAWTISQQDHWGLGMDMSQDCSDCCARCGDVMQDVIILN